MDLTELRSNPEAYKLIELIEELIGETEVELVRMINEYTEKLRAEYGYEYKI